MRSQTLARAFAWAALAFAHTVIAQTINPAYFDQPGTYSQIGNSTITPDGSTYSRIGNSTVGPDGIYTTIGNITYAPDGGTYSRIGNTTIGPDGSMYSTIGNTTFGPNVSCSRIGSQTVCN